MKSETFDPPAGGSPRANVWNPRISFVEQTRGRWKVAHRSVTVILGPCSLDDVATMVLLWSGNRGATRTWHDAWYWLDGWTVSNAA